MRREIAEGKVYRLFWNTETDSREGNGFKMNVLQRKEERKKRRKKKREGGKEREVRKLGYHLNLACESCDFGDSAVSPAGDVQSALP